ncbi:MAG: hypothetical protein FWG98_00440 [Candidatus Cloacimonetes bacterium]|nr:hypothetical protein [Candidatus Cloacimonadota bacterium]
MDQHAISIAEINATLDRIIRDREKEAQEREIERKKEAQERKKEDEKRKKEDEKRKKEDEKRKKENEKVKKEADERMKNLDALMASMTAQVEKTSKGITELRAETSGISESNGMLSEAYFYSSLLNSMSFGGVDFDQIDKSVTRSRKLPDGTKIRGEYDVVMHNGDTIALIEIKFRARTGHAEDLINRKINIFKQLFPEYANHKFLLGLGGLSFEDGVEDDAINHGIGILKTKGESIEIIDNHLKIY